MPIYSYKCTNCNESKEVLQKINAEPLKICEICGNDTLVKQLTSAVFGFKGTGYYCTDFKNN